MTSIVINEHTTQGKAILSLIKTLPKAVVISTSEDDDLSDCISSSEFFSRLKSETRNKIAKKHSKK